MPLGPTRPVPSWWFGDGAALLNEARTLTLLPPELGGVFVGGGVRKALGGRSGLRVGARLHMIGDPTSTRVTAAPVSHAVPTGVAFVRSSQAGTLIVSALTGLQSSLSAPLDDFETFRAGGMRLQLSATIGYDVRF